MGSDASHSPEAPEARVRHKTTVVWPVLVSFLTPFALKKTKKKGLILEAAGGDQQKCFLSLLLQRCSFSLSVGRQRSGQDPPGPQRGHPRFHQTSTSSKNRFDSLLGSAFTAERIGQEKVWFSLWARSVSRWKSVLLVVVGSNTKNFKNTALLTVNSWSQRT